ncbi:uncharacterized protein LOC142765971 [Rhipicephalus microplus]|uniref:uncharacterized protein LOC142765971 n=1 Tax=Rhipicephalus microplus TaxID=6941 RepID=UPI003F6B8325
MSSNVRFLAFYFTIIWLESLVGNTSCSRRSRGRGRVRLPSPLSDSPPSSLPRLGTVVVRGHPPRRPFSPTPGPSGTGSSSPVPGPSEPSSPPRLSTVVVSAHPPRRPVSPMPGPSGSGSSSPVSGPSEPASLSSPEEAPVPGSKRKRRPLKRIVRLPQDMGAHTLALLRPAPGEPGSPENPGTMTPGPTQIWFASAFYRNLIPIEQVRRMNEYCNEKTICEDNTCCLTHGHTPRRCKPLGKRGENCSPRTLSHVYFTHCPCGVNQGTCDNGVCT